MTLRGCQVEDSAEVRLSLSERAEEREKRVSVESSDMDVLVDDMEGVRLQSDARLRLSSSISVTTVRLGRPMLPIKVNLISKWNQREAKSRTSRWADIENARRGS